MTSPILIIQPTGDKRGHYALFTCKLAQALAARGRLVVVVTNRLDASPHGGLPANVELIEIGRGRFAFVESASGGLLEGPRYWYRYFRNSFLVTASALRLARTRGIRDIYITDCEFLVCSLLLLIIHDRCRRVLMQVNAANFSFSAYQGGFAKKIYKHLQVRVFRVALRLRVSGINALGSWHAERLREQLALRETFPIEVIPDGADMGDGPVDRLEARTRLGLSREVMLMLVFGNFRRDKDYSTLFRAFALLRNPAVRLALAGHLAEFSRAEIDSMIDFTGMRERIAWSHLDFLSAPLVRDLFSAADALLMPYGSGYVGGSGPLRKEAATFARPVIVSDVAEMGRLVRTYDLGLVYETGNPEALAAAMDAFCSATSGQHRRWGENCRDLGSTNSWEKMAVRFEEFFRSIERGEMSVNPTMQS